MEQTSQEDNDEKREQANNGEHEEIIDFVHPDKEGSDPSDKSSDESNESGSDDDSDKPSEESNESGSNDGSDQSSEESNESGSNDGSDQSSQISDDSDTEYDVSPGFFEYIYHCYPLSQIEKSLPENGDKIIMPTSAFTSLLDLGVEYPMQFQIRNESTDRVSHCGVLEFTGNEDSVYLPIWMMENMQLQEGDRMIVQNVSLDKGTYMKLQPHTTDFISLPDMKDMLEDILRNFSCLTIGDTIMINHNSKKFYIDIIETKPSTAINIIDTDCEVEFAPPLDYKEPEKSATKNAAANDQGEQTKEERKFIPFTGLARRLDGKNSTEPAVPEISSELKEQTLGAAETRMATQPNFSLEKRAGKHVFSSQETQPIKKDYVQAETSKKEKQNFQPFTGKKYKLTD
uniref:Ubiquitin fusion degradation protein n=1 Tax=Fagus sylvatica TaxID=28930 RepID=A0A2N9HHA4_FAGSY